MIAQLTNKCPECSERKGSWGSCDTCNGFHADLWTDTFAAVWCGNTALRVVLYHILTVPLVQPQLTGCDPLSGGCNPGIIPIKIGDPVPCPATTPKIFYRDSQGFYQSFMVTGMRAAFVSASIPGFNFRVQANEINGVILNLDAVQPSQLPGSFPITITDADGGVYTCQVSNGAAGSTFPCGGGGAIPAPVVTTQTAPADPAPANPAPANPAPADTPADTTAPADGLGGSTAVTAASTTTGGCDALRPANGGSSYASYKQCALATPGAWPPQPVAGSLAEYQQCGDDSAMPFATRCESGTVCCQTVSNYAQCIDPSDGPALAKCTTKY